MAIIRKLPPQLVICNSACLTKHYLDNTKSSVNEFPIMSFSIIHVSFLNENKCKNPQIFIIKTKKKQNIALEAYLNTVFVKIL